MLLESSPAIDDELAIGRQRIRPRACAGARALLVLCGLIAAVTAVTVIVERKPAWWIVFGVGACGLMASVSKLRRCRARPERIAIVGGQMSAVSLEQELETNRFREYELVGWIAPGPRHDGEFPLPEAIGRLGDVASVVREHEIDLLVLAPDVPRLAIFDELLAMAACQPVRALELSAFYDQAFGHIPITEINSTWFQCIMHPKFRPAGSSAKRLFDVVIGACIGLVCLPTLLISALLIKLDGGPVLYRQRRIGERGEPFAMYKLRTMRLASGPEPQQWCSSDDPRVTLVGRGLRRMHLDELPQLYNVLRGEMSLVGPRPEQPDIVTQLEDQLAFYSRRHLIKPGLTGWAQIRCGYARSESGSAWKLCHDLYYLKHQSMALDFAIMVRTFVTLASRQSAERRAAEPRATEPRATEQPSSLAGDAIA